MRRIEKERQNVMGNPVVWDGNEIPIAQERAGETIKWGRTARCIREREKKGEGREEKWKSKKIKRMGIFVIMHMRAYTRVGERV